MGSTLPAAVACVNSPMVGLLTVQVGVIGGQPDIREQQFDIAADIPAGSMLVLVGFPNSAANNNGATSYNITSVLVSDTQNNSYYVPYSGGPNPPLITSGAFGYTTCTVFLGTITTALSAGRDRFRIRYTVTSTAGTGAAAQISDGGFSVVGAYYAGIPSLSLVQSVLGGAVPGGYDTPALSCDNNNSIILGVVNASVVTPTVEVDNLTYLAGSNPWDLVQYSPFGRTFSSFTSTPPAISSSSFTPLIALHSRANKGDSLRLAYTVAAAAFYPLILEFRSPSTVSLQVTANVNLRSPVSSKTVTANANLQATNNANVAAQVAVGVTTPNPITVTANVNLHS